MSVSRVSQKKLRIAAREILKEDKIPRKAIRKELLAEKFEVLREEMEDEKSKNC